MLILKLMSPMSFQTGSSLQNPKKCTENDEFKGEGLTTIYLRFTASPYFVESSFPKKIIADSFKSFHVLVCALVPNRVIPR